MLRLLRVRALQYVTGRARVPEVSANQRISGCVKVEYREIGRIRVSLRGPLVSPVGIRSGIRDHGKVDGGDRTAKTTVRHMAGSTRYVLERRHIRVVIQETAEYSLRIVSVALNDWGITCVCYWWQRPPLLKVILENALNLVENPSSLGVNVGRQNARRIRIIGGRWALRRAGGREYGRGDRCPYC